MDDGLLVSNQGFYDERALDDGSGGGVEYCRLPCDASPFPEDEEAGPPGECFACVYGAKFSTCSASSKNSKHIYDDMMNIITNMYGKTSNETLVSMVHSFYEQEIRKYFNYPAWSKRCIWEHIHVHSHDENVQTSESIQTLTAAIELVRTKGLCQKTTEGAVQVDHKNARIYMDMVKTRDALIANRLKRKAV
jgi:hypothetical protein